MTEYTRGSGFGRFVVIILLLIVVVAGVWYYNKTHVVTAGDHVGKAVDAIPAVVSKAADEVTDKDNLDKVGDAIKDTGQAASSALSKTGKAAASTVSETAADTQKKQDKHP
ncbi:hypothetical protein [Asticcacaulis sp.]|uniref:hypothetical protein n=1 Tax=Asticcacaulis sp. TaxID=1872648 RepID=UPI002CF182AB|nr:hypothetical protein [Asticcacaulis sp.]HTM81158.1 hypothetical protein [Asticcacaulis sp.]